MDLPRRPLLVTAAVAAAAVLGVGGYLFQPWLLLVDEEVSEALPVAAAAEPTAPAEPAPAADPPQPDEPMTSEESMTSEPSEPVAPAGPVELATGSLISHEHTTTGTARVLELADGSRVLRLEGLDTTNGPDLHVWLTDAPVLPGRDGWGVFDDGAYVDLGPLKGNQGDANYEIPADVDLTGLTSVSIWCARFAVSFGAAELV